MSKHKIDLNLMNSNHTKKWTYLKDWFGLVLICFNRSLKNLQWCDPNNLKLLPFTGGKSISAQVNLLFFDPTAPEPRTPAHHVTREARFDWFELEPKSNRKGGFFMWLIYVYICLKQCLYWALGIFWDVSPTSLWQNWLYNQWCLPADWPYKYIPDE